MKRRSAKVPLQEVLGLTPYAGDPRSTKLGELLACGHWHQPSSSAEGAGRNGLAAVAKRRCPRCGRSEPVMDSDRRAKAWLDQNPRAKGLTL